MIIKNRFSLRKKLALTGLIAAGFLATAPTASAATYYWDSDGSTFPFNNLVFGTNIGGTGAWNTSSAFWYNPINYTDIAWPNSSADTAVFFGGTTPTVTVAGGGVSVGGLQFLSTGYTLAGGPIALGSSGMNVYVGGAATTISSVINGSNGLGLVGTGTLTLNTASTNGYTGETSISNGTGLTLNYANIAANTSIINSASTLKLNSGTLTLTAKATTANVQTFAGTSVAGAGIITQTIGTATSLTTNLGPLTRTAGGTLNFTIVPSATVVTTTDAGTANVNGILGPWASVGLTTAMRYATKNGSDQIVAFTGTTAATLAAVTDTTGAVNYEGALATGTFADNTSVNTLRFNGTGQTWTPSATTGLTLNGLMQAGTGLLTIDNGDVNIGATNELVVILNAQSVTLSGTGSIKNNGANASGLTLNATGAGTLTLTKQGAYTGPTTVNAGTLTLGAANVINSASTLNVNGGTVGLGAFNQSVAGVSLRNGTISGTATLTSTSTIDVQSGLINVVLAGSNGLVKSTPGTVTLNPAAAAQHTFTGGIQIKAGTLATGTTVGSTVNAYANVGTITLGDDVTNGSDVRFIYAGTATTYGNPIVLKGGPSNTTGTISIGTTNASTSPTFTGGITGTGNLTFSSTTITTGVQTFSSVDNVGSFTSASSGSTGGVVITTLGTNVKTITQAGAGIFTVTNAITPSATMNTFNSFGGGTTTFTGGIGAGTFNLTFNANSTGAFTVGAINTTGTVTNSGTGAGVNTISGLIAASVTNVIENSTTSQLTLNNVANAFGSLTIKSGTVQGSQASTPGLGVGALGSGNVTIGDSSLNLAATLIGSGNVATFFNPIILGGSSAAQTITNGNAAANTTFSGGVGGSGNLVLSPGTTTTSTMILSGLTNNAGAVSTNATATGTGKIALTGGIGSSVTSVSQNSSTAPLELSGASAYTGPTNINAGILTLASGSLAGTAVSGVSGTTFAVLGDSTIGTSGNGSVALAGTSTLSLVGSSLNTLTVNNATSGATVLTLGSGGNTALNLEVGATADKIVLGSTLKASIGAGGVTVNIAPIGAFSGTTQTLISAPGGGLNTGGSITLNTASGNFGGYTLGLSNTGTLLQLTETANVQNTLYFKGVIDAKWNTFTGGNTNNSNWTTDALGNTDGFAGPTAATDVHFYAANATTANLVTTLGQNYTVKTLTMDGGALTNAVSIAPGGGTLTITPASATTGLSVNSGAGTLTISAPIVLGASQTWTNDSASLLTASGGFTGTANLTTKANSTAGITISTITLNNVGTLTNSGSGAGTVTVSGGIGSNVTQVIQASSNSPLTVGSLAINSAGTTATSTGAALLTNSGATTGTGNLVLNTNSSGGITFGAMNQTGTITVSGSGSGTTTINGSIASTAGNITLSNSGSAAVALSGTTINNTGTISNISTSTGAVAISGIVSTNVTGILQNSTSSKMTLTGASTFTGTGVTVKAGLLEIGTSDLALGGTALTLGDTVTNAADVSLRNINTGGRTYANVINLASGTTGTISIGNTNGTAANFPTFTGGVTGNNNLVLFTTGAAPMTFSSGALNFVGNLTNSGTGAGLTTISSVIGSNVMAVNQSGTSPLTLSGTAANTYTGLTTLSAGTLTLSKSDGVNAIPGNLNITGGSLIFTAGRNETIADTATVTISGGTFNGTSAGAGQIATVETFAAVNMTGGAFNTGGAGGVTTIGTGAFSGTSIVLGVSGSVISGGSLSLTDLSAQTANTNAVSSFALNGNSTTTQTKLTVGAGGLAMNNSVINLRKGNAVNTLGSKVVLDGDVTTAGTAPSFIRQDTATGLTVGNIALELGSTGTVTRNFNVGGSGADLTISVPVTSGAATTANLTKLGAGAMTLNQANTYNGATLVSAGSLIVSGTTGSINGSSGITINGASSKLVQTSSVAMSPTVTLTQGIVDGTTTINTLSVGSAGVASTKIVTAGNSGAGTLTIGTLTFDGAGTINVVEAGAAVSTKLATTTLNAAGGPGSVIINVTNSGSYGLTPYDLINYSSFGTGGFSQFTLGTVSGLTGRQSASLVDVPNVAIQLQISGTAASLVWSGAQSTAWTTTPVGGAKNWTNGGSPDEFFNVDNVTFDDTAVSSSPVTVNISDANVSPTSTTFNNTTAKNYILQSTGGYAIATGNVTKSNIGTVTLASANLITNGLIIDRGTVAATANQILGSLTFGSTNTTTTTGVLDLSTADATVSGALLVQTNNGGVGAANNNRIVIGAARTLTVQGNVTIGSNPGGVSKPVLYGTGGGTLTVANAVSAPILFQVGAGNSSSNGVGTNATADFSGLSNLNIILNASTGVLRVNSTATGSQTGTNSTFILPSTGAGNSTITANVLAIGDGAATGNGTPADAMLLGTGLNTLNVNTINIGTGSRDFGSLTFNSIAGTLKIRDAITAAAGGPTYEASRAILNLGATGGGTGVLPAGNVRFDVRGHDADLRFGAVTIGNQNRGTALPIVFGFDTGTLDISTLSVSSRSAPASTGTLASTTTSDIFLGGGNVTIGGTVNLSSFTGTASAGAGVVSNLNISGGNISLPGTASTSIRMATNTATASGSSLATVNITGGTVTLSGDIIKNGTNTGPGTATATLILNGGTLDMGLAKIGGSSSANNLDTVTFASGTLKNVAGINNGQGLTKTTSGTLILTGTNAYPGPTAVSQGTLLVNSSLPNSAVTVSSGATLGGGGTLGGTVLVSGGANLSPGTSPGQLTFTNGLTLAATSNFNWELSGNTTAGAGTNWDQVVVSNGALNVQSTVNFVPSFIGTATNPSTGGYWTSSHTWSNVFDVTGTGTITSGAAGFTINNAAWSSIGSFALQPANAGMGVDLVWTAVSLNNNSQILISSSPDTSSIVTGASTKSITIPSVFTTTVGLTTTLSQAITKTGSDTTTYTVTPSGDVASTTFGAGGSFIGGPDSASGTITLTNNGISGTKSGTVTITNTAASGSAGFGNQDANDVFTVTQNVFQTASITGAATGGNLSLTNAASTDGGQRAGITVSGFALSNAATDNRRASNFNAPVLANGGVVGNATASDVTATVGTYSLKADRLNNATVSYRATATATGGVYTDTALAALATPTIPTLPIIANQTGAVSTVARDGVMGNYGSARLADIANGDTLAGYSSTVAAAAASGTDRKALGTTATILAGTATSDMTVSMAWRVRGANESSSILGTNDDGTLGVGYLISDVVNLSGMGAGATDTFVLQMSYSEALLGVDVTSSAKHENDGANNGRIALVWNNAGVWENAVMGNFGGTSSYYKRAYNSDPLNPDNLNLGRWGVDTTTNTVWAVLNHNSEFAVIPEPSTLVLGGLALLGLAGAGLRKRRMSK